MIFLSVRRKYGRYGAFLSIAVMFVAHVKSSDMCIPRNLKLDTLSTLSPLTKGAKRTSKGFRRKTEQLHTDALVVHVE